MDFWQTFWATMWGALGGAIVAAFAAWLFSLDLRRRDRDDRNQERREDREAREAEQMLNLAIRDDERRESAAQRAVERELDASERHRRAEEESFAREEDREFQRTEREEQEAFRERMREEDRNYANRLRQEELVRGAWAEYAERLTDAFEAQQLRDKNAALVALQRAMRQRTIVATLVVGEDAVVSNTIVAVTGDVTSDGTRLVWLASAVLSWAYRRVSLDDTLARIQQIFDPDWEPYTTEGNPRMPRT